MSALTPLPRIMLEPYVRAALLEDLGAAGDVTSTGAIPANARAEVRIAARKAGRIAGLDLAALAFALIDPAVTFTPAIRDGEDIGAGGTLATLTGPARAILTGERVALNFLGHLSGIATQTRACVEAAAGTHAHICCTRKTTPTLRALEKYAVRAGGGFNHRFGLYDGILIKDNHIAIAGGILPAVTAARAASGHPLKIEVEIDGLQQLDEALAAKADVIMFDNMSLTDMTEGVKRVAGRALTEASGGVTLERVAEIARTGVDLIAIGWITHSAPTLDIGLDFDSLA